MTSRNNPEKHAGGRPTKYTDELADEICNEIASTSIGLKKLCDQHAHWPTKQTIFNWLYKHSKFFDQYIKAKQAQALVYAEETIEIADYTAEDTIVNDKGNLVANNEFVNRSRLRVETRKWHIERLQMKIFGNKVQTELTGKDGAPLPATEHIVTVELVKDRIKEILNKD